MAHSIKLSKLFETLIMLIEDDNKGMLFPVDDQGDPRCICTYCTYSGEACATCPLSGSDDKVESLRALLPMIKAMELIDES